MPRLLHPALAILTAALLTGAAACSSTPKKLRENSFRMAEGKRVALVDIDAENSARSIIEVSLVNALTRTGYFDLVAKEDVTKAKALPGMIPGDVREIAKAAGAEFALSIHAKKFFAEERKGHSNERVYDSQLAAERGRDAGETDRLYEVRVLEGEVETEFVLTHVETGDVVRSITKNKEEVIRDSRQGAIRMPPRLRFLEQVTQKAVDAFFDQQKR